MTEAASPRRARPHWVGFERLAVILRLLGLLMILFSPVMLPPLGVALWYGDGEARAFLASFVLVLSVGILLWVPSRERPVEIRNDDAFLVVVLFWLAVSALGALPLTLSERPHMSLVDAVFEAVSGLTTTGATVLSGIDGLPRAINFYRCELELVGGMGIVVLAVALLPMLGIGGMQLYLAETPGPMKQDKLTPRIAETAKKLWYVYTALVALCTACYWVAGMGWFDAVTHSFTTMSLGGLSTHDASIGYFQSAAVELVAGVFTLVAGVNFALHFVAWRSFSLRPYLREPEFRLYVWVMGLLIAVTCAYLYLSGTYDLGPALYHGLFQASSIISTNGLTTTGYPGEWPGFLTLLLVMGSFFGGCAGSTCGGIKSIRFLLLYKMSLREMRLLLHRRARVVVKLGETPVPDSVITAVWSFYFFYIFSYCVLSVALVATGMDLVTAFGSAAAGLNNMGVGLGATAAGFGGVSDTAKWLLSFSMLLGRLEIFPLLLLFLPDFWRR